MSARILIVDDEPNIRDSLCSHFKFMGYEVYTACDGKAALEHLAQSRTDIVISDIVMPVMNGVELLKRIREVHPMIRVIMITGYVTQENALACMRFHADDLIFKPFEELEVLEQSVERSLLNIQRWNSVLHQLKDLRAKTEAKS